jgi:aminoglycoside N3'-acetyltransferase
MTLPQNLQLSAETVKAIGLGDSVVCLHSSLRSFGHLAGGAKAVIEAFLNAGCTLVVPAFTYDCEAPPLRQILQNGLQDAPIFDLAQATPFDQNSAMISREMGAIPARLLEMQGRVRGDHPLNSFAAIGPLAAELIAAQSLLNVYGPLKKAYSYSPAYLVLAGVDLTSATAVHFAEEKAGRRPFRRWAKQGDGQPAEIEVGSCSDGFNKLGPVVNAIERWALVGESQWRIFPFRAFINAVAEAIVQNPAITHCENLNCARCNDAVKGGPCL